MLQEIQRQLAALADVNNPAEQPTNAEIDDLERRLGLHVPDALRAWFLVVGRSLGEVLMGTSTSFDKVEVMTADARSIMKRWGRELPADAVVFMSHQGTEFTYVLAGEGPDPAVYHWGEGGEVRSPYKSIIDLAEALFSPV